MSYAEDLAAKFSNDCRAVMRSEWYQRTFSKARIDKAKDTETEVRMTERGYRLATSVGGTLTGRGGDVIIIDGPIKPQDAQSKSVRDKTIQWYENTLLSRLCELLPGRPKRRRLVPNFPAQRMDDVPIVDDMAVLSCSEPRAGSR